MRAVVLTDAGLRFDAAHPDPEPARGEAVVRVLRAGICGTDLEMLRGYKGFRGVPGHEFVGVVERADDAPPLVGRRVVGEINVACGRCASCVAGRRAHCDARAVVGILGRNGALAERVALPVANLHAVPDSVSDDAAVFVEPLAAACRVAEQVEVGRGTRAAVLGRGRLGSLIAAVLRVEGCDVTPLGRADDAPRGFDVVVDATGSPDGLRRAQELVRPAGTIVLKSTCAGAAATIDATRVVVDEVTIVGSRCGPFARAIELLATRRVDVAPLVDATYRLRDFAKAFEHAARPGALKVLLDPAP